MEVRVVRLLVRQTKLKGKALSTNHIIARYLQTIHKCGEYVMDDTNILQSKRKIQNV